MAEKKTVADHNAVQQKIVSAAKLPRTLMGGTTAMRQAGKEFLPQELAESAEAYAQRLADTVLYNAYANAVQSLVGKVFSEPVAIESSNSDLMTWAENIDNNGRDLNRFARDVLEDSFHPGISYILVDYSTSELPPNATVEDVKKAGLRPYWTHIKTENLLAWQSENIDGKDVLTRVQIIEFYTEIDDWDEVEKSRIRVLYPGKYEIYEEDSHGKWQLKETKPTTLNFIPLVPVYTKRTGFMDAQPFLEDLAFLNCAHWRSSSDYRRILHVAQSPILAGTGLDDDNGKVVIGPNRLFKIPVGGDLKYVEHTGAAIDAGRKHLEDLKDEMAVLAFEPLVRKAGNQTATETTSREDNSHSALQEVAINYGDSLELAFQYTMMWIGGTSDASVNVNSEFGVDAVTTQDLDCLFKTRNAKDISREAYLTELKLRGVLAEDYDIEKDAEKIDAEPVQGINPADFMTTPPKKKEVPQNVD